LKYRKGEQRLPGRSKRAHGGFLHGGILSIFDQKLISSTPFTIAAGFAVPPPYPHHETSAGRLLSVRLISFCHDPQKGGLASNS
jgi:hypothetical protein